MNQKSRLTAILAALQQRPALSLKDIMQLTGTSRDTARRDIVKLAANDLVERNYGGISRPNTFKKLDQYLDRDNDLMPLKQALARATQPLINTHQPLFLDVSTTVACLPQYLTGTPKDLLVTNSLDVADQALRQTRYQTQILGGTLDPELRCVTDANGLLALERFQFDTTVLSCAGVTATGVDYAYDVDVAYKTALRAHSRQLILVFDHTKVGVKHNFHLFDLDAIDYFVTDQPLPADIAHQIPANKLIITSEVASDGSKLIN